LSVLRYFVFFLFLIGSATAQELKVAAASDLTGAMQKLAPAFEKQTGIHVSVSLGSSGNFFAQIQNGAPFDVFLSADRSYPEKLLQAGQAEPGTLTGYARGALVIWTSKKSGLGLSFGDNRNLTDDLSRLTGPGVAKIAIANPEHAPYGRAAVAALQHYKIYDQVKSKLVLGENISQTAQFLQSGNVDVGFLSLSTAISPEMESKGRWLLLPGESYPPIEQAGVIVRSSKNKEQARRFMDFLISPEGWGILAECGFKPPHR
jgi:molybdate transport system substrate-binding protein